MPRVRSVMLLVAWLAATHGAVAQQRSMAQDPTLNNLRHAPGTETTAFGELGGVRKVGSGPRVLLLIPGLGFGDDIWTEFMERHSTEYTMYAVTLPGFDGTRPLAMPPEDAPLTDVAWTRSAISGIRTLLDREQVKKVTIVAHWIHATQLAILLANEESKRVEGVVLIGGVLKNYFTTIPESLNWTAEQRVKNTEAWATRWFKTVTRETWDDNNFMPYDYAVNPRRGLHLWRQAQAPSITVWIRYLLEFWILDVEPLLSEVRVPVLLIQPQFDDPGFYVEHDANYMKNYCINSWVDSAKKTPALQIAKVPMSRLFVMYDTPDEMDRRIKEFTTSLDADGELARPNEESSMILGLGTVVYQVSDLQRAKSWYAKTFGITPYFDEPFYVGFNVGGYELGLNPDLSSVRPGPSSAVAYWRVRDIDQAVKRFVSEGATVQADIEEVGEGIKLATVGDPDGNSIGLIENARFKLTTR